MSKINKVLITGGARGIGAAIAQQCKKMDDIQLF